MSVLGTKLGWVDLQRALARSGGEALLPQCFRQSSKRERVTHLHERVPLALRLACFRHLQHVLARREGLEEAAEFRLGAACWDIADHHLRGGKPLSAVRVQAELLRPSAQTGCTWKRTEQTEQAARSQPSVQSSGTSWRSSAMPSANSQHLCIASLWSSSSKTFIIVFLASRQALQANMACSEVASNEENSRHSKP